VRPENLRILIVGGGGREHALYRAIGSSPLVQRVICSPGNGGIPKDDRRSVPDSDFSALVELARAERIDFVVVGPEVPLVNGMVDVMAEAGIPTFGPTKAAARLEGSKAFTKALCTEMGVPTADYATAASLAEAEEIIARRGAPIVIKADGLCAGKGVVVAATEEEARAAAGQAFVDRAFGAAGELLVIEECLSGPECSVVAICDGEDAVLLPPARDHKRAFDGDKGPNTGGMGAYAPLPDVDGALLDEIKQTVILPVLRGMAQRGTPYHGALFAGLMLTPDGPRVIEFNCRFGDPETQVMLPLLRSDIVPVLTAALQPGGLSRVASPVVSEQAAVCVVLASADYPSLSPVGLPITGLETASEEALVFQAGTRDEDGLVTSGGRVLNVVGLGASHDEARARAYSACAKVSFDGKRFRSDIAALLPAQPST
jgi:phosphoribosylamine--glycine ligase